MAKKKSKAPVLRPGLSVEQLLQGTWMASPDRYTCDDEMVPVTDELLRIACQRLIDEADLGGRVTRRTIINTLCQASTMLKAAKDHITEKMGNDEFTPTLLDKIANA